MRELPEVTSGVSTSFDILGLGERLVGVVFEYGGGHGGQSRGLWGTCIEALPSLRLSVLSCHEGNGLDDL